MITLAIKSNSMGLLELYSLLYSQIDVLDNISIEIKSVRNNLDMEVLSRSDIEDSLDRLLRRSENTKSDIKNLSKLMMDTADEFKRVDEEFYGEKKSNNKVGEAVGIASGAVSSLLNYKTSTLETTSIKDSFEDLIGSVGVMAKSLDSREVDKIIEAGKSIDLLNSEIGNFAGDFGCISKGVSIIGKLIGFNYSSKGSDDYVNLGKGYLDTLDLAWDVGNALFTKDYAGLFRPKIDTIDDYILSTGASISSKVSTYIKWGSVVLTGLEKIVDNTKDYDYDWSNPRMYAAIGLETALETGLIFAVGAATGGTGLIAVAAGAAIINGGNALVKWASGGKYDGISEIYSEAILNAGEAIHKTVNTVAKTTKKVVKSAVTGAKKVVTKVAEATPKVAKAVFNGAKEQVKKKVETVKKQAKAVKNTVKKVDKAVGKAVKTTTKKVTSAWNKIKRKWF